MGWLAAMIITEEIARASSSLRVQIKDPTLAVRSPFSEYVFRRIKAKGLHPEIS